MNLALAVAVAEALAAKGPWGREPPGYQLDWVWSPDSGLDWATTCKGPLWDGTTVLSERRSRPLRKQIALDAAKSEHAVLPMNLLAPLSKPVKEAPRLRIPCVPGVKEIRRRRRRLVRMSSVAVEQEQSNADPHHHKLTSVQGATSASILDDTGFAVVFIVSRVVRKGECATSVYVSDITLDVSAAADEN